MALTSAHYESDRNASERQALEWLESLGSPSIRVSACELRKTVTTFVPVNDTASPIKGSGHSAKALMTSQSLPVGRARQPRHFPVAIPEKDQAWMIWDIADASEKHLKPLDELCTKVVCLGHSASLVQMWVDKSPPKPNLVPNNKGPSHKLRIPGPGRLKYLERCYNEENVLEHERLNNQAKNAKGAERKKILKSLKDKFGDYPPISLRPAPGLWAGYSPSRPEKVPALKLTAPEFSKDILVFRQTGGRKLGLESTLTLTSAFRGTIMGLCPQPPPEWISGHKADNSKSDRNHLAILPLPHVGWKHADGHLLGIALALPREIQEEEVFRCLKEFYADDDTGEAPKTQLKMGRLGEWTIEPERREVPQIALQAATWTEPSNCWATVTPLVLDRYPKAEGEAEDIVARACESIGLPKPTSVVLTPVSIFIGSPHSHDFPPLPRKVGKTKALHAHAVISFSESVQGPVLLGAGRYRGYGLCRPYKNLIGGHDG
jgi:CRISPR-associated protein Csb2